MTEPYSNNRTGARELTQDEIDAVNALPVPDDFITTGFATVNGQSVRCGYTPIFRLLNPTLFGDDNGGVQ